jgi:hypothetical protein
MSKNWRLKLLSVQGSGLTGAIHANWTSWPLTNAIVYDFSHNQLSSYLVPNTSWTPWSWTNAQRDAWYKSFVVLPPSYPLLHGNAHGITFNWNNCSLMGYLPQWWTTASTADYTVNADLNNLWTDSNNIWVSICSRFFSASLICRSVNHPSSCSCSVKCQ